MKTTSFFIPFTGLSVATVSLVLLVPNRSWATEQSQGTSSVISGRTFEPRESDNSKRPEFVFIGGQVNVPQRYVYTNGMTVMAAIKMARGLTDQAAPTKVALTRASQKPITLDLKAIEVGKTKDIELQPGDKVHVPKM
jgi:hypothetical protein